MNLIRPLLLALTFAAVSAAPCGSARAQVVNVLPLLSPTTDPGGFHLEATGGGSLMTGNVKFLTARGVVLMRYRLGRHRFISSTTGEFGRGGGDPFLNRQTSHLRYQNEFTELITGETFVQATHDDVWRLKLRALAGAGLRLTFIDGDTVNISMGVGYLIEHEQYSEGAFGDSGLWRLNHRLASYANYSWRLDPQLSLVETVFFQPRFDEPSDMRVFSQSALVVKLREKLALSVAILLLYNSWTPETIVKLDTSTVVSLTSSW